MQQSIQELLLKYDIDNTFKKQKNKSSILSIILKSLLYNLDYYTKDKYQKKVYT